MRNFILAALAACVFMLGSTAAFAASEMPMMYELKGEKPNVLLAGYIQVSLTRDPSGNGLIPGSPCTTPNDFLKGIREYHPDVKIDSVADLPGLIRSAQVKPARAQGFTGSYAMSRMICQKPDSRQKGDALDLNGTSREFRSDEVAFFFPNHDEPFMAGDCKNLIKTAKRPQPVPPVVVATAKQECFAYHIDGRGSPVKQPLELVVDFYRHDPADLHRLMADDCFYAVDGATGARMRLDRECATCKEGDQEAIWPSDVSVGEKTDFVFSVYSADGKTLGFPSGYGTVYVPFWFLASSRWCATSAHTYVGKAPPWDHEHMAWEYESYYSLVTLAEVSDGGSKELHRVLKLDSMLGE